MATTLPPHGGTPERICFRSYSAHSVNEVCAEGRENSKTVLGLLCLATVLYLLPK